MIRIKYVVPGWNGYEWCCTEVEAFSKTPQRLQCRVATAARKSVAAQMVGFRPDN
jgi:hypothetical protein